MMNVLRKPLKGKVATPISLLVAIEDTPIDIEHMEGMSITLKTTDTTPADDTFVSGVQEVQTLTFADKAGTTHQDYIVVYDQAGLSYAIALTKPINEVQTLTFPTKAAAANGDYIVVENTAGTAFAVALTKPVAEVQTLTFPTFAGLADRDYIVVENTAGIAFAVYADKTGTSIAPTGAAYVAADFKVKADVSAAVSEADVAAVFETAFNSLTGFTASITTDDTAADGTMTLTSIIKAPVVNPDPHNFDDSGVGSILGVETVGGVAAQTPTGAAWVAADFKGLADISADTTAAQVAARAETALNLLTGFTASITSDDSAANGTMLLTSVAKAPVVNPDPHNFNDSGVGTILGVETTAGVASTAPSGAAYTAVASARKALVDLTSATTAAQVAALAEIGLDALTGLTAAITTDDTAANGTMLLTQVVRGPTTNPVPHNENDSGAGSIAGVQTTAGVTSDVNLVDNEVTMTAHGYVTGLKVRLTTSSALPTGLLTATDYYIIAVDDDTLQFALSYADALAGTDIDITDYGVGTQTIDTTALAGAFKLQISNNCFVDNVGDTSLFNPIRSDVFWDDLDASSQTYDGTTSTFSWDVEDLKTEAIRLVWTPTAGQGTMVVYYCAKGPGGGV